MQTNTGQYAGAPAVYPPNQPQQQQGAYPQPQQQQGAYPQPQQQQGAYPQPQQQQSAFPQPQQQQGAYPQPQQQQGAFPQPGYVAGTCQQQPSHLNASPPRRDYSRQMVVLNSMQTVNTGLNVSFGVAELFLGSSIAYLGVPIWAPLCFYLPAGILGVLSGKIQSQRRCLAVACLVMSILAAITACSVLIFECAQAVDAGYNCYNCTKGLLAARRAVSIVSALVALLEMVVSIVASAYCCMVIGSTGTQAKPMTVQVYTTTTATPVGAYNISSPPQFAAPQSQYTAYPGVMPAARDAAGDATVQLPPPSYNQDPLPTKQ